MAVAVVAAGDENAVRALQQALQHVTGVDAPGAHDPNHADVGRVAQSLGLTLEEIGDALASLPDARTPTKRDWEKLSRQWQQRLDARIAELQRLRDRLTKCIGCGCLSLKSCALYNTDDMVAQRGSGPRLLLED